MLANTKALCSQRCPWSTHAVPWRAVLLSVQITFQPYACRMLDTLRRLAVYGLMSTLFMLMLVTLSESQDHDRLLAACMIIVALINLGKRPRQCTWCATETIAAAVQQACRFSK